MEKKSARQNFPRAYVEIKPDYAGLESIGRD